MKKKIVLLALLTLTGISFMTSCKKDKTTLVPANITVTQYVESDDSFSILAQALTKANLADVLNGNGNFTVFAPTNDAFNALFKQCLTNPGIYVLFLGYGI